MSFYISSCWCPFLRPEHTSFTNLCFSFVCFRKRRQSHCQCYSFCVCVFLYCVYETQWLLFVKIASKNVQICVHRMTWANLHLIYVNLLYDIKTINKKGNKSLSTSPLCTRPITHLVYINTSYFMHVLWRKTFSKLWLSEIWGKKYTKRGKRHFSELESEVLVSEKKLIFKPN